MTKKKKRARKSTGQPKRHRTTRRGPDASDPLLAPVTGAERRTIGHVRLDVGRAGGARVKRMVYPPGFRWSVDMKPIVVTNLCMHAHVGFIAHGEIQLEYPDGCVVESIAPAIVAIYTGY